MRKSFNQTVCLIYLKFISTAYELLRQNSYKGCDFSNLPPRGRSCDVDLEEFEPCTKENSYGYDKGTPCVFLKLSRDPEWFPQFYNVFKLPVSMPADLKKDINESFTEDRRKSVKT